MKNRRKMILLFGAAFAAAVAGCDSRQEKPQIPTADISAADIPTDDVEDTQQKIREILEEERENGQPEETGRESELLEGNVNSIGENSLIVSKAFPEGEDVLVSPADGSEDQVMVTVMLSENTQYEMKIVKNGGVNGDADVEKQSGSFSDLENEMTINVLGYYKGEEFIAEKICMYKFV